MKRVVRIAVVVALITGALSGGSALANPGQERRADHQATVDFWTVERVRQAQPRDFVFDSASGRFQPAAKPDKPGKPGGGGGGGKGDTSTVTGAPWNGAGEVLATTGKVFFELGVDQNGNPLYWVCSASVVDDTAANRSIILTAAHCAYDNEIEEFATKWIFIPAYDDTKNNLDAQVQFCRFTTYGCWTADALVVHDGFASAGGFNSTAITHDFAFAVVGEGGHSGAALAEDVLGSHPIDFSAVSKGTDVSAFGYPHAESFNRDLYYCAGPVNFDNRLFKLTYRLECSMTGGASGGPHYKAFENGTGTAISVNSYRYSSGDAMYGPKFDANTAALFSAALSATEDTIVRP